MKRSALTTAILAAMPAITAFQAGGTVNGALALKTDATRMQALASDPWAYYQAKGLKAAAAEAAEAAYLAQGKTSDRDFAGRSKRYEEEQKEIEGEARHHEAERDE